MSYYSIEKPIKSIKVNNTGKPYKYHSIASNLYGDKIVISSDKGLFLVNEQIYNPNENQSTIVKKISNTSSNLVSWNHATLKSNLLLYSSSDNLSIMDMKEEKIQIQMNYAHARHITSIDWNKQDGNLFASASGDCILKIWDLREFLKSSNSANVGPINSIESPKTNLSKMAWYPFSSTLIASSHDSEIKIWDTRKFGSPLISFTAHIGQITSIDWSSINRNTLLTSGSDKLVKVWDLTSPLKMLQQYHIDSSCNLSKFINYPNSNHNNNNTENPQRYTDSISSISQKSFHSNSNINFYSPFNKDLASIQLSGHKSSIVDFNFTKYNQDFHLISLGKDDYLNIWNISNEMLTILNQNQETNLNNNNNNIQNNTNSVEYSGNINFIAGEDNSSLTPKMTSSKPPLDLQQELFKIRNEKFKDNILNIEKSSYTDKICIVNLDSSKIMIIITFPLVYPRAPPSFNIIISSESESLPACTTIRIKLKKKLDKLSNQLLETGKPFLIQLLESLVEYYLDNKDTIFAPLIGTVDSTLLQKYIPKSINNQPSKRLSTNIYNNNNFNQFINNNNNNTSPNLKLNINDSGSISSSSYSSADTLFIDNNNINISGTPTLMTSPLSLIGNSTNPIRISITSPNLSPSLSTTTTDSSTFVSGGRNRSSSTSSTLLPSDLIRNRSISHGSFNLPTPNIPFPTSTGNNSTSHRFGMYIVKPTDTLTGISIQHSMPRDILIKVNRLLNEKLIAGTVIWVYKKDDITQSLPANLESLDPNNTSNIPIDTNTPPTISGDNINTPSNQLKINEFLEIRSKPKFSHSPTVNINNLFKPSKEEVEMAFSLNGTGNNNSRAYIGNHKIIDIQSNTTTSTNSEYSSSISSNWLLNNNKFSKIPKEHIVKEKLVCFMKDKKVFGNLTLTPYQMIFQSIDRINMKPISLFYDYSQIMSCKFFPNKTEWIYHLSKDWNKEQYWVKKNQKSKESQSEYDKFIHAEIGKLNEMEDEDTRFPSDQDGSDDSKVLVFPCIYVLILKENIIQTLFFRGITFESVQTCFSYLKKLIVDRKLSSSRDTSPSLQSPKNTSPSLTSTTDSSFTDDSSLNVSSTSTFTTDSTNSSLANSLNTTPISKPIQIPESISLNSKNLNTLLKTAVVARASPKLLETPPSFEDDTYHSPQLLQDKEKYKQPEQVLLTPELFKKLRHYLPIRTQGSDIELLFNSTSDGVSFSTFYRKQKNIDRSILLVKDNFGYVFGAYISEKLEPKKTDMFYGTGETFLFSLIPELKVFKWTRENDLFIYSNHEIISIGGGSMYGLWLNNDFVNGYSGPCETFGNATLSKENDFSPVVVELWGIKY